MKQCALFISNEIYLNISANEGGVSVCTDEYLRIINELYNLKILKVKYNYTLIYRLRVKLGVNIYNDYRVEKYANVIFSLIEANQINIVFLNQANTAPFASLIKKKYGASIKVILCSHGNESGDFLHTVCRFKSSLSIYRLFFSSFTLGGLLRKEAAFRENDIDAVLTVSPIEEAIEYWLGARHVLMIPRTVQQNFIDRKPKIGRIGFIGDLSHAPNYFGVTEVCNAIKQSPYSNRIDFRLVGNSEKVGNQLEADFPFVTYLGYLDNEKLMSETTTWRYFINPVFYYSRGVSTKLAKALGLGIPIITTKIGCRGYYWDKGNLINAETPLEMAQIILECAVQMSTIDIDEDSVRAIVESTPRIEENAIKLKKLITKL